MYHFDLNILDVYLVHLSSYSRHKFVACGNGLINGINYIVTFQFICTKKKKKKDLVHTWLIRN